MDGESEAGRGGWFTRLEEGSRGHDVGAGGAAGSPRGPAQIIHGGGHTEHRIFRVDETDFCWKMMPPRTFTVREQTPMPGVIASKHRLTRLGLTQRAAAVEAGVLYHPNTLGPSERCQLHSAHAP